MYNSRTKAPTVTMPATPANKRLLSSFPCAGPRASISGMRKHYWGYDVKIVRCGQYIYNLGKVA